MSAVVVTDSNNMESRYPLHLSRELQSLTDATSWSPLPCPADAATSEELVFLQDPGRCLTSQNSRLGGTVISDSHADFCRKLPGDPERIDSIPL